MRCTKSTYYTYGGTYEHLTDMVNVTHVHVTHKSRITHVIPVTRMTHVAHIRTCYLYEYVTGV